MPTYEFICDTCHTHFEKRLSFKDDLHHVACPSGHTQTHKKFTPPSVVYKGSGFYVTDNRSKGTATE